MSQLDLRLLVSIAIHLNIVPKSGDVSQAFIQSMLPDNEPYVCWPPAGCPLTPPNSYWKLIKTLYGLKRSPRHWFNKAKTILEKIGLKQSPHSPCIFSGQILPNKPPLYLGFTSTTLSFLVKILQLKKHSCSNSPLTYPVPLPKKSTTSSASSLHPTKIPKVISLSR